MHIPCFGRTDSDRGVEVTVTVPAYLVLFLPASGQTDVLPAEAISVNNRLLVSRVLRNILSVKSVGHHSTVQTVKWQRSLACHHLQMIPYE
jgi:hypothetical protein